MFFSGEADVRTANDYLQNEYKKATVIEQKVERVATTKMVTNARGETAELSFANGLNLQNGRLNINVKSHLHTPDVPPERNVNGNKKILGEYYHDADKLLQTLIYYGEDCQRILTTRNQPNTLEGTKFLKDVFTVREYGTDFNLRQDMFEKGRHLQSEIGQLGTITKEFVNHFNLADVQNNPQALKMVEKITNRYQQAMAYPVSREIFEKCLVQKVGHDNLTKAFGNFMDNQNLKSNFVQMDAAQISPTIVSKADAQAMMSFAEKEVNAQAMRTGDTEVRQAGVVLHSFHTRLDSNPNSTQQQYESTVKTVYNKLEHKIGRYDDMLNRYANNREQQQEKVEFHYMPSPTRQAGNTFQR